MQRDEVEEHNSCCMTNVNVDTRLNHGLDIIENSKAKEKQRNSKNAYFFRLAP